MTRWKIQAVSCNTEFQWALIPALALLAEIICFNLAPSSRFVVTLIRESSLAPQTTWLLGAYSLFVGLLWACRPKWTNLFPFHWATVPVPSRPEYLLLVSRPAARGAEVDVDSGGPVRKVDISTERRCKCRPKGVETTLEGDTRGERLSPRLGPRRTEGAAPVGVPSLSSLPASLSPCVRVVRRMCECVVWVPMSGVAGHYEWTASLWQADDTDQTLYFSRRPLELR